MRAIHAQSYLASSEALQYAFEEWLVLRGSARFRARGNSNADVIPANPVTRAAEALRPLPEHDV